MTKRRVCVVTYHFPPDAAMASRRLQGLAKYLPEFGWDPVFLTPTLPGDPDPRFNVLQVTYPGDASAIIKKRLHLQPDRGFQEQLGVPLAIRGSKRPATNAVRAVARGVLAYPDDQKHWYPHAVDAGSRLLSEERFDALLSSAPPFTTHRVASALQVRHDLPWVADFRDLWTQSPYYTFPTIRKVFERRLEVRTLEPASAMVSTSRLWADQLQELHGDRPAHAILNGFDPDSVNRDGTVTPRLTITHTGILYQGRRDPEMLFRVLSSLIRRVEMDPGEVEVRFYGPEQYWLAMEIEKYRLGDVVKQYGGVPPDVSVQKQRESQILLLLSWNDPRERGTYTGKVFEYLAARRPIVGVGGPRGVVSELLETTSAGHHTSDPAVLEEIVLRHYREFKETGVVPFRGDEERIAAYSHMEMARQFAAVLDDVSGVTA